MSTALSPELSDDWIESVLKEHNKYRQRHGACPLEWHEDCASAANIAATACAKQGKMFHNSMEGKELGQHGQNIFFASNGTTIARACAAWYSEIEYYFFNSPQSSAKTGHFTQLVWHSTKYVGVAVRGNYLVANYFPAGNFRGKFEQNVFPSPDQESAAATSITPPSSDNKQEGREKQRKVKIQEAKEGRGAEADLSFLDNEEEGKKITTTTSGGGGGEYDYDPQKAEQERLRLYHYNKQHRQDLRSMHIKVTGERSLFTHMNRGNAKKFYAVWEVNGGIPLGSLKHLDGLRKILHREILDDIVLFYMDVNTFEPMSEMIDPSLTCYDLRLTEGTFIYLTTNPCQFLVDWSPGAITSISTSSADLAANFLWSPLSSSSVRFLSAGDALSIEGLNRRRVVKKPSMVAARGGTGGRAANWNNSVALANTKLANDEVSRWSFRVLMTNYNVSNASIFGGGPSSKEEDEEEQEDFVKTMLEGDIDKLLDAGGEQNIVVDVEDDLLVEPQNNTKLSPSNEAIDELSLIAAENKTNNNEDLKEGRTKNNKKAAASQHVRGEEGNKQIPHVMLGVSDDNIPLDSERVFINYPRCWMLDVISGAFYSGADRRPTYVDLHNYFPHDGMIITFALDSEKGVLNVLFNGKCVLVSNVTRYLADALYPCVEVYSENAAVELM